MWWCPLAVPPLLVSPPRLNAWVCVWVCEVNAHFCTHKHILGQHVFPVGVSVGHVWKHWSGRGLWRIMLKGWESLETSSSLPQSIRSGSIHLRMTPRRLGVLKLSSGGFYLDTKNVLLNLYQLCCSSSCGFNFVLLSVMFLISLGQVFTKTSKNILKWL